MTAPQFHGETFQAEFVTAPRTPAPRPDLDELTARLAVMLDEHQIAGAPAAELAKLIVEVVRRAASAGAAGQGPRSREVPASERAAVERWLRRIPRQDYAMLCAMSIGVERGVIRVAPEVLQEMLLRLAAGDELPGVWCPGAPLEETEQ